MNNVEKLFHSSKGNISAFASGYFKYLGQVLDSLDLAALEELSLELDRARNNGRTIFVAGNGGSAATASTMANDIGFDIVKKTGVSKPFRVLSLNDNNSVLTAIANDSGYENIFLNQLRIHYRDGDKLIVVSASGNSENLIEAVKWVRSQNGLVIGFLGFSGGTLLDLCDIKIHVPTEVGEYGPVEDSHLIINHIIAHWFQKILQ